MPLLPFDDIIKIFFAVVRDFPLAVLNYVLSWDNLGRTGSGLSSWLAVGDFPEGCSGGRLPPSVSVQTVVENCCLIVCMLYSVYVSPCIRACVLVCVCVLFCVG